MKDQSTRSQAAPTERWRALALLATVLVLAMSTWFSASAVVPQLRDVWGLSNAASAWLTISVQIGFVTGAVVSSLVNLADVVRPRRIILIGSAGAAFATASIGIVDSAAVGISLRFATGFFLAGVYPPAFKVMSTWFRRDRGTALGVLAGAIVLGNSMPHLVNGLGGLDWRIVVFVTAAMALAGGILSEAGVREGPFPFPRAVFDPKKAGEVFANRGVRLATVGYMGHMWEMFAMYAWFSVFFAASLQARGFASGSAAAYATFLVIGVGALGCWLGGWLADTWGRTKTAALSLGISGACAILVGLLFGTPSWLVLAVGLIWGLTVAADSAQFSTIVTELADQAYVGTALTLQMAMGFTITVATIWLIPVLADWIGWRWSFAFLAPGSIIGALAVLRLMSLPEASRIAGGRG